MQTTTWNVRRHEARAERGMVAAKHPLAVDAGLEVLREGGNAVDAAITTALTIGVVEPPMSGVGGGGFMLFHDARTGQSHCVDYFMTAPGAATPDMYEIVEAGKTDVLGFRGVKDDANIYGYQSIGVPGLIRGAALALQQFGTIRLARALAPAIRLAEEGYVPHFSLLLNTAANQDLLMKFPATAAIFLRDGRYIPRAGGFVPADKIVQTDLARTLRRVADQGPDGFYRGDVARAIVADLQAHGNRMTEADLAGYQARVVPPRVVTYRDDYQLVFAPSTGGTTLAETFNILEGFDFAGRSPTDADSLHLFIEAARIAYADRWRHLADEDSVDVPFRTLESKAYAAARRRDINPARAADKVEPWAGGPFAAGSAEGDGGCTTHLSVVDKDRNMVAITQTINQAWGSAVVVPGTGVLFNDTMVLFDPNPGRANSIVGGKKPLSSMTPLLVLKGGWPFLTVGAPGGRQIMGTVMRVAQGVIDFGQGIQDACETVALDASADTIVVDADLGDAVIAALRDRGHVLDAREKLFMPRLFASPTGILIDPATGELRGGADPFAAGVASGY